MRPKRQRLVLLCVAVTAMAGAGALSLSAIGDSATYFYSPSDAAAKPPQPGEAVRLGGLVEANSIARLPDGLTLAFRVTDNAHATPVRYRGIAPDLFREGTGVIATGAFAPTGIFIASTLLAKHDEKYMPPEVEGALHKTATATR